MLKPTSRDRFMPTVIGLVIVTATAPLALAALKNLPTTQSPFYAEILEAAGVQQPFESGQTANVRAAEAHYNLGMALYIQGQFESAIAEFRRAIQLRPDFAEAHFGLGSVLLKQSRYEEAIAELRQARDLYKAQGKTLEAGRIEQLIQLMNIQ
jgi:tetratricopeptide (TPR) repeat protein